MSLFLLYYKKHPRRKSFRLIYNLYIFFLIIIIVSGFFLQKEAPSKELSIDIQLCIYFLIIIIVSGFLLQKDAPSKELEMMTMIILVNVCITKNVVYFVFFSIYIEIFIYYYSYLPPSTIIPNIHNSHYIILFFSKRNNINTTL